MYYETKYIFNYLNLTEIIEKMFEIMDHFMYTNFCTLNDLISVLKTALWAVFSCFIKSRIILKLKIVNDLDE